MLKRSTRSIVLMLISNGDSVFREGDKLTSNNHGFKVSSIRTSKPKSSKQLLGFGGFAKSS
jgi:hypothetical protein